MSGGEDAFSFHKAVYFQQWSELADSAVHLRTAFLLSTRWTDRQNEQDETEETAKPREKVNHGSITGLSMPALQMSP